MANGPQSLEDRRSNLSDRMSNGRQDWQQNRDDRQQNRGDRQDNRQQNRGDRQDDRQEWRDQNREDWQNWADGHMENYGDWYHGSWYPGSGWNYMWDNYPVAAALGLTAWGLNRIGYGWGYSDYSNPYYSGGGGSYGYDYSEPLVMYADSAASASADAGSAASTNASQPTDPGMAAFEEARIAFRGGDYTTALSKLDTTLQTMPRDTVVHEFRSLVFFALQKYPESSAAIYAVLAAGPGWDWTTLISLYPGVDAYTAQLRALEEFVKANPKSPDGHFLLGYHYQTMGHAANASAQYKLAQTLLPNDKLIQQLVEMTTPAGQSTQSTPPVVPAVPQDMVLTAEKFVGKWTATSSGATFNLDLTKDGGFTWTYTRGKKKQSIQGAFAVDQNNLALETTDGGGTMLAEVTFTSPTQFQFKMIGDSKENPGLTFKKQ